MIFQEIEEEIEIAKKHNAMVDVNGPKTIEEDDRPSLYSDKIVKSHREEPRRSVPKVSELISVLKLYSACVIFSCFSSRKSIISLEIIIQEKMSLGEPNEMKSIGSVFDAKELIQDGKENGTPIKLFQSMLLL